MGKTTHEASVSKSCGRLFPQDGASDESDDDDDDDSSDSDGDDASSSSSSSPKASAAHEGVTVSPSRTTAAASLFPTHDSDVDDDDDDDDDNDPAAAAADAADAAAAAAAAATRLDDEGCADARCSETRAALALATRRRVDTMAEFDSLLKQLLSPVLEEHETHDDCSALRRRRQALNLAGSARTVELRARRRAVDDALAALETLAREIRDDAIASHPRSTS